MRKRLEVTFRGHVQGVGFRATTQMIARRFHLTGYVKNMPDGSVYVVTEGDEESLQGFLSSLQQLMVRYIQQKEMVWKNSEDTFDSFRIAY